MKKRNCLFCEAELNDKRPSAKFCHVSCRCRYYRKNPWTDDERDFLRSAALEIHSNDLTAALNRHNKAVNHPVERTRTAVYGECKRLGIRLSGDRIDNLSSSAVARMLDIHYRTVVGWIKKGLLVARKRNSEWSIKMDDLVDALWENPGLAISVDPENLKLLLLNRSNPTPEQMMDAIAQAKSDIAANGGVHCRISKRIHCVDNNTTYRSLWAAAAATGCTHAGIRYRLKQAIEKGWTTFQVTGVTFAIVDSEPKVNQRIHSNKQGQVA